eukprot:TRINITY_DN3122_c1_g1_i2.p1 TRINITY_DN3122_c1_g1~~TRINITY_DN3122_c1_g1_i2.p1  ORF type:complete len:491 (-),score=49.86 TRINITY_DN3122_c1_g1_i2:700-2172(-)
MQLATCKDNSILVKLPADTIGETKHSILLGEEFNFISAGKGSLKFEGKGPSDVGVLFYKLKEGIVSPAYHLIIGSNSNKRTVLRKGTIELATTEDFKACPKKYNDYWINVNHGIIQIGEGELGHQMFFEVRDDEADHIHSFGLTSFAEPVNFRNIEIGPPCSFHPVRYSPQDTVKSLFSMCVGFVTNHIGTENALEILLFALDVQLDVLEDIAMKVILKNLFKCIIEDPDTFQMLPLEVLQKILSNSNLACCRELSLVHVVVAWSLAQTEPFSAFESLLPYIRFGIMLHEDKQIVFDFAESEPRLKGSTLLRELIIHESKEGYTPVPPLSVISDGVTYTVVSNPVYNTLKNLRHFQRRQQGKHFPCGLTKLNCGMLYGLGLIRGRGRWVNPDRSLVRMTASSPATRLTRPADLLSTRCRGCNYASGSPAYWMVDLGETRRAFVTNYLMKQDSSSDFPRNWILKVNIVFLGIWFLCYFLINMYFFVYKLGF